MKKNFIFLLTAICSSTIAQQTISFEANEGFQLGTINSQNGWEVSEGSDGLLENQIITDEFYSQGEFSFKNSHEDSYDSQWLPIMGAALSFNTPITHDGFSISYDIMPTQQNGADFEFTIYAIDNNDYFTPVAGVGIENRGYIYFINNENYGFEYADAEWNPEQWINIKIEVTSDTINYYVNNTLDKSIENFSQLDIYGFNMLHNNYGGSAYYDNIVISSENASIENITISDVKIYPNPVSETATVLPLSTFEIQKIEVFNLNGQKVKEQNNNPSVEMSVLPEGIYLIKITDSYNRTITRKVIKK